MLVLTRKLNQSFWVGDDIEIKVVEIKRDRVRIGINAPAELNIRRSELPVLEHRVGQDAQLAEGSATAAG